MYIIRNQGFFYTDEYYAAGEVFRRFHKKTFRSKAAADQACAAIVRAWVRSEPLGNYLFDDGEAIDAVVDYMRAQWPDEDIEWDGELEIPDDATDKQVDEIVKRMGVTFAQVFEVDEDDDEDEDEDEDDDVPDDLHFGPDDGDEDDDLD